MRCCSALVYVLQSISRCSCCSKCPRRVKSAASIARLQLSCQAGCSRITRERLVCGAMGHELPWASFRDLSARPPISDVTLRCDSWRDVPRAACRIALANDRETCALDCEKQSRGYGIAATHLAAIRLRARLPWCARYPRPFSIVDAGAVEGHEARMSNDTAGPASCQGCKP